MLWGCTCFSCLLLFRGSCSYFLAAHVQDYILETMESTEAAASPALLAADRTEPAAEAEVASAEEEVAEEGVTIGAPASGATSAGPALKSKVVVASPASFDPRSLRQLKKEIAAKMAGKHAAAAGGSEEEGGRIPAGKAVVDISVDATGVGVELTAAMGALSLGGGMAGPLRGVPTPAGSHIRWVNGLPMAMLDCCQRPLQAALQAVTTKTAAQLTFASPRCWLHPAGLATKARPTCPPSSACTCAVSPSRVASTSASTSRGLAGNAPGRRAGSPAGRQPNTEEQAAIKQAGRKPRTAPKSADSRSRMQAQVARGSACWWRQQRWSAVLQLASHSKFYSFK